MKIAVSLYFWGESLVPADITNALKIKPSQSQTKGEVTITSTNKKVTAKIGMWGFSSDYEIKSENLGEHISCLRLKIGNNLNQILSLKNVQDSCVDVFIANDTETDYEFELTNENIISLMEIGLPVRFTVANIDK
jgi:hypothetical protein